MFTDKEQELCGSCGTPKSVGCDCVSEKRESREDASQELLNFLDKVHADRVFDTAEHSVEFLKSMTFESFMGWINRVNGILRNKTKEESIADGNGFVAATIGGDDSLVYPELAPPQKSDRLPLLQKVFEAVQTMDNVENIPYLLSVALIVIHPYNDGNGRTSRLIFSLLHDGFRGKTEEKQRVAELLSESGRTMLDVSDEQKIQPYLSVFKVREYFEKATAKSRFYGKAGRYESWTYADNVSLPLSNEKRACLDIAFQTAGKDSAMYEYTVLKGYKDDSHWVSFSEAGIVSVSLDAVFDSLQSEADVDELIGVKNRCRKAYVEDVISVFAEPEKFSFRIADGGAVSVAELYKEHIQKRFYSSKN